MNANWWFQELEDKVSSNVENYMNFLMELVSTVSSVELDAKNVEQYISLAHAVEDYAPAEKFNGETVLIHATEHFNQELPIPNEDYNVSKVTDWL